MPRKFRAVVIVASVLLLCCGSGPRRRAARRGAVPAEYRTLYNSLEATLDGLDQYLETRGTPSRGEMTFSAELLPANGNRGTALLDPRTMDGVKLYLDRLQEIGVGGVTLSIGYPQFMPDFPRSAEYVSFYRGVAAEVRRRDLKLMVGLGVVFANTPFSEYTIDYSGLTLQKLAEGKREMAAIILRELSPDYLTLGSEPDTEAALTGIEELNTPAGFAQMVNVVLRGVDRGTTRIGAGIGSWGNVRIAESLARDTSLDVIDIHVYPIWKVALQNIVIVAETARRYGKGVTMDEAWLYKALPHEATSIAANEELFRRDVYSFWSGLDQRFLTSLTRLARLEKAEFFSPFWSTFFFGYLDYSSQNAKLGYRDLVRQVNEEAVRNLVAGRLTPTGTHYQKLIAAAR